jgi:CDP-glucose 4,6-dehydratase
MNLRSTFSGKKILITGHTGFKGTWLTLWLKQMGANVSGISIDVPTNPSHFSALKIDKEICDIRADIREGERITALIQGLNPDFIFHMAAQPLVRRSYLDPLETWSVNTFGTLNVLESLRRLSKPCVAIFITSDKCYDNVEWVWGYRETDKLGGPDPYSASKGAAELAIRSYVKSYFPKNGGIRIGIGRAGNVIGGGDWAQDRIVPDCVRAWAKGEVVSLRNPSSTRPWQHVLEPLSGYLNLASELYQSESLHGEPFNFGPLAQQNHSVGDLVGAMSEHWDQVRWSDLSTHSNTSSYESGLLKLNCDKALHYLGWTAIWDFKKTVEETAVWYKKFYESNGASIFAVSIKQISRYHELAKEKGLKWAQ